MSLHTTMTSSRLIRFAALATAMLALAGCGASSITMRQSAERDVTIDDVRKIAIGTKEDDLMRTIGRPTITTLSSTGSRVLVYSRIRSTVRQGNVVTLGTQNTTMSGFEAWFDISGGAVHRVQHLRHGVAGE
jgi:outer membrane protein assembly factor BamE (lipoprotein component of BamABCDE complex)